MCDEVRSVGFAELPDGPRFRVTHQDQRLTVELSVPCDLLRELVWHGDAGSDQDAGLVWRAGRLALRCAAHQDRTTEGRRRWV